jgi:hypothetical protein
MVTGEQATAARDALSRNFPDAIAVPGDSEWDASRYSFNLVIDQQPEAVVHPSSAEETAAIVRAARELGSSSTSKAPLTTRRRWARSRDTCWCASAG